VFHRVKKRTKHFLLKYILKNYILYLFKDLIYKTFEMSINYKGATPRLVLSKLSILDVNCIETHGYKLS